MFSTFTNENVIFVFDVDGVLVPHGDTVVPKNVRKILTRTRITKVMASGKPLKWCWIIGRQINTDIVFAENALVYQFQKGTPVLTTNIEDIARLKQLLDFRIVDEALWSATITLDGVTSDIIFEPEKSILTLWVKPREKMRRFEHIVCRWDEEYLLRQFEKIIACPDASNATLNIKISGPYKDGGIDFLPVGVDKGTAIDVLENLFPKYQIVVFVDDFNDAPMVLREKVFAVTFGNAADQITSLVQEKQNKGMGMIFEKSGYEGGLEEALKWILNKKDDKHARDNQ